MKIERREISSDLLCGIIKAVELHEHYIAFLERNVCKRIQALDCHDEYGSKRNAF